MKHIVIIAALMGLGSFTTLSQSESTVESSGFNSVVIGDQEWMTTNLDVITFQNGDTISFATSDDDWYDSIPLYTYYDYNSDFSEYGVLYNQAALTDPRGLAPKGWHIASTEEWKTLFDRFGGIEKASDALRSRENWDNSTPGSNESGLSLIGSGVIWCQGPGELDRGGYYWCSSGHEIIRVHKGKLEVEEIVGDDICWGLSVRCVKD